MARAHLRCTGTPPTPLYIHTNEPHHLNKVVLEPNSSVRQLLCDILYHKEALKEIDQLLGTD